MAKSHFSVKKRKKEFERKHKQEEKRQRKLDKVRKRSEGDSNQPQEEIINIET
jgi:hypothetical protein